MFDQFQPIVDVRGKLKTQYRLIAVAFSLAIVGAGLCGTDHSTGSLGGMQSLWGATFSVPGVLVGCAGLLNVIALKLEERRLIRNRDFDQPKDNA